MRRNSSRRVVSRHRSHGESDETYTNTYIHTWIHAWVHGCVVDTLCTLLHSWFHGIATVVSRKVAVVCGVACTYVDFGDLRYVGIYTYTMCVCMYMYAYVYMYIYTHIHRYIRIHSSSHAVVCQVTCTYADNGDARCHL
jgi:hypothetical protein